MNDIPVKNMRGQGYDGASNMSSGHVGVQARIREVAPLATYVHCSGHCLNLVISKSCLLPDVRNVVNQLHHCCQFFLNSPKRSGLLEFLVAENVADSHHRKPLLDLCKTRWAERQSSYQHFYQAYTHIVQALELIGYRRHLDRYGDKYADWDTSNRTEAQQILASITSFGFIIGFLSLYQYLSHLAGITIKLQRTSLDILEAHELIGEVISLYKTERQQVTTNFALIYRQGVRMAEEVGSQPDKPRATGRQQHRSNPQSSSIEDYFKKVVAIPLLEHIISALQDRFSAGAIVASSLLGVIPSICCVKDVSLERAIERYSQDLPAPELLPLELRRWKARYCKISPELRPSTPAEAIKNCDADLFPNLRVLLQIACTIPVTSCECERSASALRRLHNYMRASMGKSRLSSLALLHIHYDAEIDLDKVIDCYARLHPRRLELESIIRP